MPGPVLMQVRGLFLYIAAAQNDTYFYYTILERFCQVKFFSSVCRIPSSLGLRVLGFDLGKSCERRMSPKFMGKRRMRARGTAGPNRANTSSVRFLI